MPLSEQEQRLLEEMERSLYHNDADFVATVGPRGGRRNYRTIVLGIVLALVGVAVTITGVAIHQLIVGIIGFVVMFVGVLRAFSSPKRGVTSAPRPQSRDHAARPGFMDRLNQRWDKRQDEQDH